jgi:hypothetical protein
VNVALSLVEHAYFVEKGRTRFDGGKDLLRRPDIVRSVFLEGASRAVPEISHGSIRSVVPVP